MLFNGLCRIGNDADPRFVSRPANMQHGRGNQPNQGQRSW